MRVQAAERVEDVPALLHDGAELPRVGRDGVIPARHVLVHGEVLLDDARAQRDGRKGHRRPQGVVAETHGHGEGAAQHGDVEQADAAVVGGIDGDAVQQRDVFVALTADRLDGLLDLPQSRHARGDEHRPSLRGHVGEERQIHDVHGGDLEERHVERLQQIGFLDREDAGAELHAPRLAVALGDDVLLGRELICAHHLAQRAEVLLLVRVLGIAVVLFFGDEGRLAPRLELDRVGTGVGGCVDQRAAEVHVAVMVGADLRDDVRRVPFADGDIPQHDRVHATPSSVVHRCRSAGLATQAHHSDVVPGSLRAST